MRKYISIALVFCMAALAYGAYIPTRLDNLHVGSVSNQSATSDALECDVAARFDSTVALNGVNTIAGATTLTGAASVSGSTATFTITGTESTDGRLLLQGDDSDDPGDDWILKANWETNSFSIGLDTPTAGTYVDKLSIDYTGQFTFTGLEANDCSITLQSDESDDSGDDWKIEADASTNSLIFSNDTSGSQVAKLTLTTGGVVLLSGGKIGSVDAQGNTNYEQVASSTLAVGFAYNLTPADGKAGSFIVIMGTHTAFGSFTTAGAVTLGSASTADCLTTDTSGKLSIYDGGTVVAIKNNTNAAQAATIRYNYVN